jgi:hypothetical protein
MLSRLFAIALVISFAGPARAQAVLEKSECTQSNIDNTDAVIAKMKDGRQKQTATSEIATAKEMLKQNKIEDCKTSLQKAELQTK